MVLQLPTALTRWEDCSRFSGCLTRPHTIGRRCRVRFVPRYFLLGRTLLLSHFFLIAVQNNDVRNKVGVGVLQHVRTCTPRFYISRTAELIALIGI